MTSPQWILLGFLFGESLISFLAHGRRVEVTVDFRLNAIRTLIMLNLLLWGGFF